MSVRVKRIQIGELSRRTGVSARMLRHYEKLRLIRPERALSGYRMFKVEDVAAVERIVRLNRAGLELRRLSYLVGCQIGNAGRRTPLCAPLRSVLVSKRAEIAKQIGELRQSYKMISNLLGTTPEFSVSVREGNDIRQL